ncbi:MAG: ATP-binding protein [Chloroflexota bacterium]
MPTMIYPARYENLSQVRDFVAELAKQAGFVDKVIYRVILAVDEAFTNIIDHAYGGEGLGDIECTCQITEEGLTVRLRDQGNRFDPTLVPEPEIKKSLHEVSPRGVGLFLMRQIMDEVSYEFTDKGNELTMVKRFD